MTIYFLPLLEYAPRRMMTLALVLALILSGCSAMAPAQVMVQQQLPLTITSAWQLGNSYVLYQTGESGSTLFVATEAAESSAAAQIEAASKFSCISDLMQQLKAVPISLSSLPVAIQSIAQGILPTSDWLTWTFIIMPAPPDLYSAVKVD